MNGYETYVELKKVNPDINVVIASGHAKTKLIDTALELGVIDSVKKPYRVHAMSRLIFITLNKD